MILEALVIIYVNTMQPNQHFERDSASQPNLRHQSRQPYRVEMVRAEAGQRKKAGGPGKKGKVFMEDKVSLAFACR